MTISRKITEIYCLHPAEAAYEPVDRPRNPSGVVGWQNRTSSLRSDVGDQVTRQDLDAERDERAEETRCDSGRLRQIVNPIRAKDKIIEDPQRKGKGCCLGDRCEEERNSWRYGHREILSGKVGERSCDPLP